MKFTWFEALTGIPEDPRNVTNDLRIDGEWLEVIETERRMRIGRFETPRLGDLRIASEDADRTGGLNIQEVVADVQELHRDPSNAGALVQAASQFNTLEMPAPAVTPEAGIGDYEHDHTQGPACAISCGAGTIYRNYFVPLKGQVGQSEDLQIDCLEDMAAALGHDIRMQNGYARPTPDQLDEIATTLAEASEDEIDDLRQELRIGIQWDTEVTISANRHTLTQVYGSALPIGYGDSSNNWEPFARLVLEASYEATLHAALVNAHATGNNRVFLTLLGGGVFGNKVEWIVDAIETSLHWFRDSGLDIQIVSYGAPNRALSRLL